MKHINILIVCLTVIGSLTAQSVIEPEWVKIKASSIGSNAEGWGVDIDAEGHVYWPYNINNDNQGLDVVCEKYDAAGTELWNTALVFGGAGTQQAYVANAQHNALYIGGRNCSGIINTCDMLLLKVDKEEGTLIWDRTLAFTQDGYDELDGLEVEDDAIYCGGWAQSTDNATFQTDIGLWKLDQDGNTSWTATFGEDGTAEHQDGHIVVDENYIYAAGLWNGSGLANLYNGYAFLGKFSKADGSFVDSTLFGYQSDFPFDIENALGMTTDGTYLYITGYTTPAAIDNWQLFIAKFDKDLNQIWIRDFGEEGTETARGIAHHNGIIYVAGLTESPSLSNGETDALLLQVDTAGNIINYQTWGGEQAEDFRDIAINDEAIYLSGTITSEDSTGLQNSAFLLKVDNEITSVGSAPGKAYPGFDVFPNPANGVIQITLDEEWQKDGQLIVRNVLGEIVYQTQTFKNQKNFTLKLDSPGLLFITVTIGNRFHSVRVLNRVR